jgi:hypothetical protein
MFMTVHAAAATIIGKQVNSSIIAFLLGLLSHFVLDMIPHGDERLGKRFFGQRLKMLYNQGELKFMALYSSTDSFVLAFFLIYLFKNFEFASSNTVIWAIVGGLLPDAIALLDKLTGFKIFKWFNNFHIANHKYLVEKFDWDWKLQHAVVMQFFVMAFLVWLLYLG